MLKKKFQSLLVVALAFQTTAVFADGTYVPDGDPDNSYVPNPTLPLPPPQGEDQPPCPQTVQPCVIYQQPAAPTHLQLTPGEAAVLVCYDNSLRNPFTHHAYCTVTDGNRIGQIRGVDDVEHPQWALVSWEGFNGEEEVSVNTLYPEVDTGFTDLNRKYPVLDPRNIPVLSGIMEGNLIIDEVSHQGSNGIYHAGQIFSVFYNGTVEFTSEMHNPNFYRFRDYQITHVDYIGRRVAVNNEWREGDLVDFHDGGLGNARIVKLYWNNTALIVREFEHNSNTESVRSLDRASHYGAVNHSRNYDMNPRYRQRQYYHTPPQDYVPSQTARFIRPGQYVQPRPVFVQPQPVVVPQQPAVAPIPFHPEARMDHCYPSLGPSRSGYHPGQCVGGRVVIGPPPAPMVQPQEPVRHRTNWNSGK